MFGKFTNGDMNGARIKAMMQSCGGMNKRTKRVQKINRPLLDWIELQESASRSRVRGASGILLSKKRVQRKWFLHWLCGIVLHDIIFKALACKIRRRYEY
jgi:hypothetical protein